MYLYLFLICMKVFADFRNIYIKTLFQDRPASFNSILSDLIFFPSNWSYQGEFGWKAENMSTKKWLWHGCYCTFFSSQVLGTSQNLGICSKQDLMKWFTGHLWTVFFFFLLFFIFPVVNSVLETTCSSRELVKMCKFSFLNQAWMTPLNISRKDTFEPSPSPLSLVGFKHLIF